MKIQQTLNLYLSKIIMIIPSIKTDRTNKCLKSELIYGGLLNTKVINIVKSKIIRKFENFLNMIIIYINI